MVETKQCAVCGAAVPGNAPFGQCPQCLVGLGLQAEQEASQHRDGSFGEPGRRFGDYELGRQLGRGGMGVVYEALQVSLNRPVALKMILDSQAASPVARRRFTIEAEAAAKLDHPHIVPIYEVGLHEDQPFLSMKLVNGESLRAKIARGELCVVTKSGPLPKTDLRLRETTVARIMVGVARAVHHAHQHGVLHRDIKPANLLVDGEGQPHLTDFGLAKILDVTPAEGAQAPMTLSGTALGTPSYMSPEQAAGQRISSASDIYSLGTVLYEMLTGQPPFKAATPLETMRLVLEQEPRRPRAVHGQISRDLDTICMKCLEKNPTLRYHTAEDLAEDLERWLRQQPIQARPAGPVLKAGRWVKRNPTGAGLIASLCLGLAAALVFLSMALKRQGVLDVIKADHIQRLNEEISEMWTNVSKTHVTFTSSQLATITDQSPRRGGPEAIVLTYGVSISEDPWGQALKYSPVLRLLENKMQHALRRPVLLDLRIFKLRGADLPAVMQGGADVKRVSPLTYLRARETKPGLELVAHELVTKDAVIFARRELGLTNLSQVAGYRVAFAHSNAIISFLAKVHLARAGVMATNLKSRASLEDPFWEGVEIGAETQAPRFSDGGDPELYAHREVIRRVLANDFDVGEALRHHFRANKNRGLVELYSFPVPPDVLIARPGLEPEVVQALRQALVSLKSRHEKEVIGKLHKIRVTGFAPASDRDFDELRRALTNEYARFEGWLSLPAPSSEKP